MSVVHHSSWKYVIQQFCKYDMVRPSSLHINHPFVLLVTEVGMWNKWKCQWNIFRCILWINWMYLYTLHILMYALLYNILSNSSESYSKLPRCTFILYVRHRTEKCLTRKFPHYVVNWLKKNYIRLLPFCYSLFTWGP